MQVLVGELNHLGEEELLGYAFVLRELGEQLLIEDSRMCAVGVYKH